MNLVFVTYNILVIYNYYGSLYLYLSELLTTAGPVCCVARGILPAHKYLGSNLYSIHQNWGHQPLQSMSTICGASHRTVSTIFKVFGVTRSRGGR